LIKWPALKLREASATIAKLATQEVQIWLVAIADFADFNPLLTEAEQAQQQRFKTLALQQHYALRRGILRELLSHYLNCPPLEIHLEKTSYGKPLLGSQHPPLHFNYSFSGEYLLYGFSRDAALGVDIEKINTSLVSTSLKKALFSSVELAALEPYTATARAVAFFRGWTRKEAFIKAIGEGLHFPLHAVEVCLEENSEANLLLNIHNSTYNTEEWSIYELPINAAYYAAIALGSGLRHLSCHLLRA